MKSDRELQSITKGEKLDSVDNGSHMTDGSLKDIAGSILEGPSKDPLFSDSKFMTFVRQLRDDELRIEGNEVVNSTPKEISREKPEQLTENIDHMAEYLASLGMNAQDQSPMTSRISDDRPEVKFSFQAWTRMYMESVAHLKDDNDDSWDRLDKRWRQFDARGLGYIGYTQEIFNVYAFEPTNPYLEMANPVPEAYTLLGKNHSINAILAFEAVVQKHPDSAEAWGHLGWLQSENERDPLAIAAFKRALFLDSGLLSAWMGIAISYSNELFRYDALNALGSWVKHHPQYFVFLDGNQTSMSFDRVDDLIHIFLKITRINGANSIDVDIQTALGLLFSMKGEFSYAIDCFRAALQKHPKVGLHFRDY